MRGFQLEKARRDRLTQLRRAAQDELPASIALDRPMLFTLLQAGPGSSRCNILTRALVYRALRAMNFTAAEIADGFQSTLDEVERYSMAELLAEPQLARSLESQVRVEIPETPEPGRYVAPSGNFA